MSSITDYKVSRLSAAAAILKSLLLLLLLLIGHHHHHLPLHHHLVPDGAGHRNEGERHLDLAHLRFGQHLLADVERRREADLLVEEDAAAAGHPGAEHGRDQAVDEDAVDDGRLERGGAGVGRVQVDGVVVARQLGEQLHVAGGERFGEGGSLAHVERPAGRRAREAQPRFVEDDAPQGSHPEERRCSSFSPGAALDCFQSAQEGTETPEVQAEEKLVS